jgi:hypothetical protein
MFVFVCVCGEGGGGGGVGQAFPRNSDGNQAKRCFNIDTNYI